MNKLIFAAMIIMATITGGYMHNANALDTQSVRDAGWEKLSASQQAAVLQQVAADAAKGTTQPLPAVSPENFQKWVDAGTSVGKGLASIVKELGITVNEFISSPAGKIGVAVLIAHVFGHELIHIVGATIGLCIWLPIWIYTYRRFCVLETVEIKRTGFWNYTKTITYRNNYDDTTTYWRIWLLIALIVLMATTFIAL